jgi:hypothetical protein
MFDRLDSSLMHINVYFVNISRQNRYINRNHQGLYYTNDCTSLRSTLDLDFETVLFHCECNEMSTIFRVFHLLRNRSDVEMFQ